MLSLAQVFARLFVNCTTPPLLAEYALPRGAPNKECIEPMLIIFPLLILLKCLKAALEQVNVLIKYVSMIDVHSFKSYSSGRFLILVPALLIKILSFHMFELHLR